ncbi:serine/threonine-protein kinase [[Phormidium] sp. LEGE 05292]|uniref:serine/threonine protein kinase n=1 Tax=[Phormidium] sp. LEGE 05292 TaxID=767427 RepID=UPI002AD45AD0|nr:serine/threonine-protein kinase [Phormidium sp. LEGE 05292]
MSQTVATAAHCINPLCPRPYPQTMGNNFCSVCGAPLRISNRYIPLKKLGVGGFAAIYTLWDEKTKKERVLKVLLETSPKALALFEQEATVLASLRHPGVPKVEPDSYFYVTFGKSPEIVLPCLVMEKISGKTLEDILEYHQSQGLPEAWVQNWLKQAVYILRELHQRKIIHRDIKPANLMLREGTEQIVLIDFGGAKQIGVKQANFQASSTRLFSPGYSPPEQIAGAVVGPNADFYALGMTCIHLLTGKYPLDLEDPKTGDLHWQKFTNVSPSFANLLDDMIQPNIQKRPANANELLSRIRRTSSQTITSAFAKALFQIISKLPADLFKLSLGILAFLGKSITQAIVLFWKTIAHITKAFFSTLWQMILGGIGGACGSIIGYWLAYKTALGKELDYFISQNSPQLTDFPIFLNSGIILFACAGLTTTWGLMLAGKLRQQQRYLIAIIIGMSSYILGCLLVQKVPARTISPEDLILMTGVTSGLLTLGLGLPSHQIVYILISAVGTAITFAGLLALVMQIVVPLNGVLGIYGNFLDNFNWTNFAFSMAFFSSMGIIIGFWLGVTHFFVVPVLRMLGWR